MKLTTEQIKSIAVGVARVEERDGAVSLLRFTKEQEEAYKPYNNDFYIKTFATAGVRLEFTTDSKRLEIEIEVAVASSRRFFSLEVYANGEFAGGIRKNEISGIHSSSIELGEGEKNVTVYLPWTASCVLRSVALDDGATLAPIEKSCKMLMFGDSITQGYVAQDSAATYASIVADALDAHAINKGIAGEKFFPTLARLKDDIEPDYITVAYGTNDWASHTLEQFDSNCKEFYTALSNNYPNAKIFALAPIWRTGYDTAQTAFPFFHVVEHFEKVTASLPNVTVINCFEFVPAEEDCFFPDLLHPNDRGFSFYAENLLKALREHID